MNIQEKNRELLITLDDVWNEQDWDSFNDRHASNVIAYWPGQLHPTRGVHNHRQKAVEFFKIFPDGHIANNPYKTLIAEGDYTCSVADFTGTFKGPMKGLDGKMIQPTNKKFQLELCRIDLWKGMEIVEERLFYDQTAMLMQIGAI